MSNIKYYYCFDKTLIIFKRIESDGLVTLKKLNMKEKHDALNQITDHYFSNDEIYLLKLKDSEEFKDIIEYFKEVLKDFSLVKIPNSKLCYHTPDNIRCNNFTLCKKYFKEIPICLCRTKLKELRKNNYNLHNIEEHS